MNHHAITVNIERCIARLESLAEELASLAYESANAEATFKAAYATTKLNHRATMKEKPTEALLTDLADSETEELRLNYLIASAKLDAARQALRATTSQLDGLRTLSAGVRSAGG